ncbi:MAG: hypothetical protein AVDCRST_MAG64-1536, partial [uncultured Phycisphaerae bacterium]
EPPEPRRIADTRRPRGRPGRHPRPGVGRAAGVPAGVLPAAGGRAGRPRRAGAGHRVRAGADRAVPVPAGRRGRAARARPRPGRARPPGPGPPVAVDAGGGRRAGRVLRRGLLVQRAGARRPAGRVPAGRAPGAAARRGVLGSDAERPPPVRDDGLDGRGARAQGPDRGPPARRERLPVAVPAELPAGRPAGRPRARVPGELPFRRRPAVVPGVPAAVGVAADGGVRRGREPGRPGAAAHHDGPAREGL